MSDVVVKTTALLVYLKMILKNETEYYAEYLDTKLQHLHVDHSIGTAKLISKVSAYIWTKDKELIDVVTLNTYFSKVKISYYSVKTQDRQLCALLVNHTPILYLYDTTTPVNDWAIDKVAEAYLDQHFSTFNNSKLLKPLMDILSARSIKEYVSDEDKNFVPDIEEYYRNAGQHAMKYYKKYMRFNIFRMAINSSHRYDHVVNIKDFKVKLKSLADVFITDDRAIIIPEIYRKLMNKAVNFAISLWQNVIPYKAWFVEKNYIKINIKPDTIRDVQLGIAESSIKLSFKHEHLKLLIKPAIAQTICKFSLELINIFMINARSGFVMFFKIAVHS